MQNIVTLLASLQRESRYLETSTTKPEGTPLLDMFRNRNTKVFMIRGGEFPPTVWDLDCLGKAMTKALQRGQDIHFIGGPLLCIGALDREDSFTMSKFLTNIVLPHLDGKAPKEGDNQSGKVKFCVEMSDKSAEDLITSNRKCSGFVEHKNQLHYRASEDEIITHTHDGNRRYFRHFRRGRDYGYIDGTRKIFGEVMEDPETHGYQPLKQFLEDQEKAQNPTRQTIQKPERKGKGKGFYYDKADAQHIADFKKIRQRTSPPGVNA